MIAIVIIGSALVGAVAGWIFGRRSRRSEPGPRSVITIPHDSEVSVHERWRWVDWAIAHCPVCGYLRHRCVCQKRKKP